MAKAQDRNLNNRWQFRREITLGTLVHVTVLLVVVVTGWSNLQRELTLIRYDLNRLIRANTELTGHLDKLSKQGQEREYRLGTVERQVAGVVSAASSI